MTPIVTNKWQKTLERSISRWRIANGIEKEVFFPQIHKPADVLAIDFTDLSTSPFHGPFETFEFRRDVSSVKLPSV